MRLKLLVVLGITAVMISVAFSGAFGTHGNAD